MTRSVLAAAVALIATATSFTSSAEACISCEYVPEVVNTPVRGKTYQKKRVVAAAKPADVAVSKRKRLAKPAPVTREVAAAKVEETATEKEDVRPAKPISTAALLEARPTAAREPEVVAGLGCKKFFATIGQTLTVPCE